MEQDCTVTTAHLASTIQGRKKLSDVAGAIRQLFAPLIYQAQSVVASAMATEAKQHSMLPDAAASNEIETDRDDSSEGIAAAWQANATMFDFLM
jgi:hypothetical protein